MGVDVAVGVGTAVGRGVLVGCGVSVGRGVADGAAVGIIVAVAVTLVAVGIGLEIAAGCGSPQAPSSSADSSASARRRSSDVFIPALYPMARAPTVMWPINSQQRARRWQPPIRLRRGAAPAAKEHRLPPAPLRAAAGRSYHAADSVSPSSLGECRASVNRVILCSQSNALGNCSHFSYGCGILAL